MFLASAAFSTIALGQARQFRRVRSVRQRNRPTSPIRNHLINTDAKSGPYESIEPAGICVDWTRVLMLGAALATLVQSSPPYVSTDFMEVKQSLYSFTVLTGVFAADHEIEGTALYGSGAICHWLALLHAPSQPRGGLLLFSLLWMAGMALNLEPIFPAFLPNSSGKWQERMLRLRLCWHNVLGILGCSMLAQAVAAALDLGGAGARWCIAGAALGVFLLLGDEFGAPIVLQGSWVNVPAWCATLLFMVPAACELVRGGNGDGLSTAAGLAIASVLLQVPRALALQNRMFFTGTSFCTAAGLLVLLPNPHRLLICGPYMAAAFLLSWACISQCRRALEYAADGQR